MTARERALTCTLYRALLSATRAIGSEDVLRLRLPVARSTAQWQGGKQFDWAEPRSAARELFPMLADGSAADKPELPTDVVRNVIRDEFRNALQVPLRDGSLVDVGLQALRELHSQIEMAQRSSAVTTTVAEAGVAVSVEGTSAYRGRDGHRWVWQYRIRLRNVGRTPVKLIARSWEILNADGTAHATVPRGSPGVVGQTPVLQPGGLAFEYASGTTLATPGGSVSGSLQMMSLGSEGVAFDAEVGRFQCVVDDGDFA